MIKKMRWIPVILVLTLVGTDVFAAGAAEGPQLGQAVSKEEIARWEIDVMPDGEGLPVGKGSAKQGKSVYQTHCLSCHGKNGLGDSADQLAGAEFGLTDEYPDKTIGTYWPYATTLFDFSRRSMPMHAPGILTDNEVYAVTAFLLYLNGIIGLTDEMNAKTLAKVKMPNRDGFINVYKENQKVD